MLSGLSESFRNPSGIWYARPKGYESAGSSDWAMHRSTRTECSLHEQNLFVEDIKKNLFEELNGSTHKLTDARMDGNTGVKDEIIEDRLTTNINVQPVTTPSLKEARVSVPQSILYASTFALSLLYNFIFACANGF